VISIIQGPGDFGPGITNPDVTQPLNTGSLIKAPVGDVTGP